MRIAFSGYLPAPCYKLVDERLQMGFEEARQYRHSLVDVLWHIVELHMIRAFYDMELFMVLAARLYRSSLFHLLPATLPATICNGCVRNTSAMLYASYVMI